MKPIAPRPPDLEPDEEELASRIGALSPAGGCPPPELLQAASAGTLPAGDAEAVERHRASCASCRLLSESLAEWEGPELSPHEEERIWRGIGQATRPAATARRSRPGLLAVAAVLAAAVLPAYLLLRSGPPDPRPVATPSAPPSIAVPVLPLAPLTVRTPPGAAIAWRGDGFDHDLRAALVPYAAGDYAAAAPALARLVERYPDAPSARLYGGVTLLMLGRAGEAEVLLDAASREPGSFWGPHVTWYLAVARERSGRREPAAALLQELCAGDSEYAARACSLASPFAPGR